MSLLYDAFGIRRVALEVNFWPGVEKFHTGELSRLFGALNEDELFSTCELQSETGALFGGEAWDYDLSTSGLLIRCSSFVTHQAMRERMRQLLAGTRDTLSTKVAFFTDEIRVFGQVPEGGKRDVEKTVRKRLMSRGTDLSDLPGLEGAGLSLSGTNDVYHWHGDIESAGPDSLMLSGRVRFWPEPEPPRPGPDLDLIEKQVELACEFVSDHLRNFTSKFIT